ncbi:hypothetical protein CDEST_00057 [Colletotrichum destructivum]|uniref:Uncharacterized protein n=1 Tax=Colletotrichum destructivum TaxID=34406 RepID=A0AAX4HW02_9PEZI|nr:hypothetical protein CDEST_00057 [Colletotrichum destructivum]
MAFRSVLHDPVNRFPPIPIQAPAPQTTPCTGRHTRGGEATPIADCFSWTPLSALFVLSKARSGGRKKETSTPRSRICLVVIYSGPARRHRGKTSCYAYAALLSAHLRLSQATPASLSLSLSLSNGQAWASHMLICLPFPPLGANTWPELVDLGPE